MSEVVLARKPAGARVTRNASWLACLLLSAAACGPGDQVRVILPGNIPGTTTNSGGGVAAVSGGGIAGTTPPATAGRSPIVAGMGIPSGAAGTTVAPPPTAGISGNLAAGTGGTGGTLPPPLDGGLPAFDAGTDPSRNDVRAGQICARSAELQCAAEQHCCAAPATPYETCKTQLTMNCTKTAFLDEIAMSKVAGYSQTATKAAFDTIERYAATCDPAVTVWAAQPDGLRSMFQGTVAPNGTCKPTGLPSQASYIASLASCTNASTTACLFTGSGPDAPPQTANCVARGNMGATCFLATNCVDGLYCANPGMTYSGGKCAAPLAVGATCTLDAECASFTCRGAVCVMPTAQTAYCVSK